MKGVGDYLRAARKAAELSSEEAAKKLGITHTTLNRYENGHRVPDVLVLMKMCVVYRCTADDLLYGAGRAVQVVPAGIPVRGQFMGRSHFDVDLSKRPEELLPVLTIHPNVYAVKVVGSGMGPIAYDGEYLILEKPEAGRFMELSPQGSGLELHQGESVGKVIGVFRRPR